MAELVERNGAEVARARDREAQPGREHDRDVGADELAMVRNVTESVGTVLAALAGRIGSAASDEVAA